MKQASLIISVYNNTRALELILSALSIQKNKHFETIIADDGSGKDMHKFIQQYSKSSRLDINHVFQDDKGFRKTRILNTAIKEAKSNYLIFIDGDCIPHSNFTHEHISHKELSTVLCGRRVNLSKRFSDKISVDKILNKEMDKVKLSHVLDSWRNKNVRSTYIEEGFILKNKLIRKFFSKGQPHIVGCNFSLYRSMMEKINGFDENYVGPGFGEDSDIEFRLRLAGYKFKSVRNLAVLFHMHHPVTAQSKENSDYFYNVACKKSDFVTKNGLVNLH
jgi:cellulose synthase/poly-beta-1,6-N-acetylglucosamine synthase-like glycosyltransferase